MLHTHTKVYVPGTDHDLEAVEVVVQKDGGHLKGRLSEIRLHVEEHVQLANKPKRSRGQFSQFFFLTTFS